MCSTKPADAGFILSAIFKELINEMDLERSVGIRFIHRLAN